MESWISASPEREEQVQRLYGIWQQSKIPPYKLDEDEAWKLLSDNIDRLEQKRLATRLPRESAVKYYKERKSYQSGRRIRRMAMAAAAAVVLLAAGLLGYYSDKMKDANQEAAGTEVQHYEAKRGERTVFTLSDGSRITLHAESRLEVPNQFGTENRELYLEGEAYFEVTHDEAQPFIVNSGYAQTRVLGTRFLVQAWPHADSEVEVVVAEGKVALGNKPTEDKTVPAVQDEVIITENQKGVLSPGKGSVVMDMSNAELEWYLGWKDGYLISDERPLSDIIPRLERWYVLDIHIENDSIGDKRLTAEIDYNQPMSEVLASIALSLGLEVEKEGRVVTFRMKEQSNAGTE